jgi:type VI secretion system protein ImpK
LTCLLPFLRRTLPVTGTRALGGRLDRVNEVTKDCFNALFQVRQLDDASLPPPEVLHRGLRGFLDALFQRATQAGFSREDANDIAYAIVALADEIAVSKSEEIRQYWAANLLQFHYFRENVAGEGFFTRLEAIQRDPRRSEILRIYYLALAFGFRGRYRVRGDELELMSHTDRLQREVSRGRRFESEMLSPHGDRSTEAVVRTHSRPTFWVPVAGVGLVVLLGLGLRIAIGRSADSVVERIARVSAANPP